MAPRFHGRARSARRGAAQPAAAERIFPRNIAITTSGVEDPLALRYCIDKIEVDNIMWAIDHPFQPTAPAVAFLETAPLSDSERAQIAHGNAERIFGISGPATNI